MQTKKVPYISYHYIYRYIMYKEKTLHAKDYTTFKCKNHAKMLLQNRFLQSEGPNTTHVAFQKLLPRIAI